MDWHHAGQPVMSQILAAGLLPFNNGREATTRRSVYSKIWRTLLF